MESVLSGQLPGDDRGEVEGWRAIVNAIFNDMFIVDKDTDVGILSCAFGSQLPVL